MFALNLAKAAGAVGMAGILLVGTTGCATKKYARGVVAPVEARVGGVEKKTADHASAINELENGLSRTDERAMEAEKKAMAAGDAAKAANDNATQAGQRADQAGQRADQARQVADNGMTRIGEVVENIDNYKLVTTEAVLFPVNHYNLTKYAQSQLDQRFRALPTRRAARRRILL